jgi:hypothetical protein
MVGIVATTRQEFAEELEKALEIVLPLPSASLVPKTPFPSARSIMQSKARNLGRLAE